MLKLNLVLEPQWLTLMPGVEVLVRPMSHAIWLSARASDSVAAAEASMDAHAWTFALGVEVAQRAITDWRGVGDEDGAAIAVSADGISALMHMRQPFNAFYDQYLGPWTLLAEEKKGFAPLPDGSSAGALTIAADAAASVTPAPGA
jgi:hypothetical protein